MLLAACDGHTSRSKRERIDVQGQFQLARCFEAWFDSRASNLASHEAQRECGS